MHAGAHRAVPVGIRSPTNRRAIVRSSATARSIVRAPRGPPAMLRYATLPTGLGVVRRLRLVVGDGDLAVAAGRAVGSTTTPHWFGVLDSPVDSTRRGRGDERTSTRPRCHGADERPPFCRAWPVGDVVDEMFEEPDDDGAVALVEWTDCGVDGFVVGVELVLADLPGFLGERDDDLAAVLGVAIAAGPAESFSRSTSAVTDPEVSVSSVANSPGVSDPCSSRASRAL